MISAVVTVHKEKEENLGGCSLSGDGYQSGVSSQEYEVSDYLFLPFPLWFWMLSLILELPEIGPGFSLLWYCAAVAATHPVGVIGHYIQGR